MVFRPMVWLLVLLCSVSAFSQDIKVTLLGTGKPEPEIERFGPSTLVQAGGQNLVFDAGRGVSQRLRQLNVRLGAVDGVFLTHLHSDHIVGLPDLWLIGWLSTPFASRKTPLLVFGPKGTQDMMSHLEQAFAWDLRVRNDSQTISEAGMRVTATDFSEGVVYEKDGVKVTAFEVDHRGPLKPAFGFRIDYKGRSVAISGDTNYSTNLLKFAKGVDVLIHEVAAARPELLEKHQMAREIMGFHTSPEDGGKIFTQVKPRLAVYTHVVLLTTDPAIAKPLPAELMERTRKTYSGPLELGEDLMVIEIGEVVAVTRPAARCPQALPGK